MLQTVGPYLIYGVIVLAVLAAVVLVALALRTKAGQDAAVATGMRLVNVLLAWLELWLTKQLGVPAVSRNLPSAAALKLDSVRKARVLLG